MSLILDALNRSRQDANPLPGLDTQHPVEHVPVDGRQWVVWAVLAVALVVIAWLLIDRFNAPPAADIGAPVAELSSNIGSAVTSVTTELKARAAAAAPQSAVAQAPAAPVQQPVQPASPVAAPTSAPLPEPQPAAAVPAVTEPAPNVAASAAQSEPETVTSLPAAEAVAVAELYQNRELQKDPVLPKPAAQAESRRTEQALREAASSINSVARSQESVDIDQILQQAREEVENASLDDNPVPFLADLSQQAKNEVPTLYYQRHDYSSDINQSSVVINGATVKAGGSPVPGMKLEEILPDSVVLNFRGTQFRLRALNSWVNL